MRIVFLLVLTARLASCSSARLPEDGEDSGARELASVSLTDGSAVDIARNDLSFVDRNFTYRHEPLFHPDLLRDDLGNVVIGLAVGLIEAGAAQYNQKSLTPSESFPWAVDIGANAVNNGSGSLWDLPVDESLPFACHLKGRDRLRRNQIAAGQSISDAEQIGMILTDLCSDA